MGIDVLAITFNSKKALSIERSDGFFVIRYFISWNNVNQVFKKETIPYNMGDPIIQITTKSNSLEMMYDAFYPPNILEHCNNSQ